MIREMLGGDSLSLESLYARHATVVFSLASRIAGDRAMAEEATQDVFMQAWRTAASYDVLRGSVRSWLLTMARTRTLDRLRANRARATASVSMDRAAESVAPGRSPESCAVETERAGVLACVLELLPAGDKNLLELAYFRGLTQKEISEATGQPLGTVKTHVRRVLQLLRAAIAGEGTKPFQWRPSPAVSPSHVPGRGILHNLKVLIVDDDVDTVKLLTLVLQRAGAVVVSATSAVQAMTRLDESVPDILVTDLSMPGQDGYDLLHEVRLRSSVAVPAVAFSAFHDVNERSKTTRAGFDLHVGKPVRPALLVEHIAQLRRAPHPAVAH
ncbi:MAG TPA: sigma-70 family RNA polymerase sigma factor [Vicinamibacterales bacterium]|nr:sigma-70 family RNA polymerase sigma factor [Vicinamibacterales bacterium]